MTTFIKRFKTLVRPAWRKLQRKTLHALVMPFALIAWGISPWVQVRFIPIRVDRIGHLAIEPELQESANKIMPSSPTILNMYYYHYFPVCNSFLANKWKELIRVGFFYQLIKEAMDYLPITYKYNTPIIPSNDSRRNIYLAETSPSLRLSEQEKLDGENFLRSLGITKGKYVCLHTRDNSYLNTKHPGINWRYHDYRNASINRFKLAINSLLDEGYHVLRMGEIYEEELDISNERYINYARDYRTVFLDIYLPSECCFFLGTDSGLVSLPLCFRKPYVATNFIPFPVACSLPPNSIFIPKKLFNSNKNKYITFHEIINSDIGKFSKTSDYLSHNIEVIDNTEEEIRDIAMEMHHRINKTWKHSDESEDLQNKFWQLYPQEHLNPNYLPRIGASFLKQNHSLLNRT